MTYSHVPFPTEGLVPEERQIGRRPAIEGLVNRLAEPGQHWALIDDRRIGKSSVAMAALARLGARSDVATVSVDLRQLGVRSEYQLVAALRGGARQAGIGGEGLKRLAQQTKRLLASKTPQVATHVAELVGAPEGVVETAEIAQTLAGLVGGDESLGLFQQLLVFEAWGVTHDVAVVVFIDEVQDLAHWHDGSTVEDLTRALRRPLRQVRCLFAGSERHSMGELFAEGRPLRENTLDYPLAPIAREDWLHELPARFAERGFRIERRALEAAVDASPGRPLRTNQICLQAVMSAPDYGYTDRVDETVMSYAIEVVRRRELWEEDDDA